MSTNAHLPHICELSGGSRASPQAAAERSPEGEHRTGEDDGRSRTLDAAVSDQA